MDNHKTISIKVNGIDKNIRVDPKTPALLVLRNDLGLVSARYGCGEDQCGACLVMLNGKAAYSCSIEIADMDGCEVLTVEGLASGDQLHPLQQALLDQNAAQCGYCSSGILIKSLELLRQNPRPSRREIQLALAGNLCRCGAHNRVIRAVLQAAEMICHE